MKVDEKLVKLYTRASSWAQKRKDTVGENNEYYITLEELEQLVVQIQEKK